MSDTPRADTASLRAVGDYPALIATRRNGSGGDGSVYGANVAKASRLTVEQFLDDLPHPRKAEIQEIRSAILESSPEVTENVKWNAPSFCVNGDDRITFRLQPGDRVDLVFHRGSQKRDDSDSFTFSDPSGLINWSTNDRGMVAFRDRDHVHASMPALVDLVSRWMKATAE